MGNVVGSGESLRGKTDGDSEMDDINNDEKFLEDILRIYKLDTNSEEMFDIFKAVRKRLSASVKHLRKTKLEVSHIVLCGSMTERTRVWDFSQSMCDMGMAVIQFNFLAVMQMPAREWAHVFNCACGDRIDLAKIVNTCKGHKALINNLHLGPPESDCECNDEMFEKGKRNFMCTKCLRAEFRREVLSNIVTNTEKSGLKFQYNAAISDDYWSTKYSFLWPALGALTAPSVYHALKERDPKVVAIHVDFMPVFLYETFDDSKSCLTGEADTTDTHDPYYLVPKSDCGHKTCLRISYCRSEIRAMRDASQTHRDAYMALQIMTRNDPIDQVITIGTTIPPYILKTAVLYHISECEQANLSDCTRNILELLLEAYRRRKMLSVDGGHINLLSRYARSEYRGDLQQHKEQIKTLLSLLDNVYLMEKEEYDIANLLQEIGITP